MPSFDYFLLTRSGSLYITKSFDEASSYYKTLYHEKHLSHEIGT